MDNRIAELAKAYVCPLNRNPTTPYELGMVRQYTAFALMVMESLGYTRPEPAESQVEAVSTALSFGMLPEGKQIGDSPDLFEEDGYFFMTKELRYKVARSILKLCQPKLKVLSDEEIIKAAQPQVAARDAPSQAKDKAHYVCDDYFRDNQAIQAAIDDLDKVWTRSWLVYLRQIAQAQLAHDQQQIKGE